MPPATCFHTLEHVLPVAATTAYCHWQAADTGLMLYDPRYFLILYYLLFRTVGLQAQVRLPNIAQPRLVMGALF